MQIYIQIDRFDDQVWVRSWDPSYSNSALGSTHIWDSIVSNVKWEVHGVCGFLKKWNISRNCAFKDIEKATFLSHMTVLQKVTPGFVII